MIRYVQRFQHGSMLYMAILDQKLIFEIHENKSFSGGWDVREPNNTNTQHFLSLDAAKNFCETRLLIK